jgi:hypothetical protein
MPGDFFESPMAPMNQSEKVVLNSSIQDLAVGKIREQPQQRLR